MKWDAPTVAHYAHEAGFGRPELHVATADRVVAGTNGIDHYDVSCGSPGSGRYVGLWAIDTDEWSDYRPDWLLRPQNAARAAYELTKRCNGFGWSAVWRAGNERHYLDVAATGHTMQAFQESPTSPIGVHVAQQHLDALAGRLEGSGMAANFTVTEIRQTTAAIPGGIAGPAVEVIFKTVPHDIVGKVVIPAAVFTAEEVRRQAGAQAATLLEVMAL